MNKGFKIYHIVMLSVYSLAIITCLVCNLAIDHKLSWFYISLSGLAAVFCVATLPFFFSRRRVLWGALGVSATVFPILLACFGTTGLWHLVTRALLMAVPALVAGWLALGVFWLPISWLFKSSLWCLLSAVLSFIGTPVVYSILGLEPSQWLNAFDPTVWTMPVLVGKIVGFCCLAGMVVCLILAICQSERRKIVVPW